MVPTRATEALNALGIVHTLHIHRQPLRSLEQAAEERGLQPAQIVRSLVFRLEDGSFILILVAGPGKISWPKLRRYLSVSRVTTASQEEVLRVTGYEPGAVSPFGLRSALRILADRGVLAHETLSVGAGIKNAGIILRREDLLGALQPEIGDFAENEGIA